MNLASWTLQAGFRAGHSTMDHVLLLHHVITFYRQRGKQVYCAFVDYSKAFDLVNRSALWCKVLKEGISGRILTVIQNMYQGAKSRVRVDGKVSDFFSCTAGVRQGENLSPILFAIYLNDFQAFIAEHSGGLGDLECVLEEFDVMAKLCVLLYADDTVLLAESAEELQSALDALEKYCKKWDLTVNLDKTNVVIFSLGRIKAPIKFMFEGKEVKVVDDYTYLGVIFNFNGCFKKAIENQKTVALRAMQALLTKIRILMLDVDTSIELFHRCVMPILLYGSEVWAFDTCNIATLDVLYKGFLKQVMHVHISTPSCMVFGETGQPQLKRLIAQRQVGFWAKLKFDSVPRLSKLILPALVGLHGNRVSRTIITKDKIKKEMKFDFKWITTLRHTLDHLGMGYIFYGFCQSEPREVLTEVKRRFTDSNTQVSKMMNTRCV